MVLAMWRPNKKSDSKGVLLRTEPQGESMVVLSKAEAEEAAEGGGFYVEGEEGALDWGKVHGKSWRDKLRRVLLAM